MTWRNPLSGVSPDHDALMPNDPPLGWAARSEGDHLAQIEHRIETAGEQPDYSGREFSPAEIEAGAHRAFIGGIWDTHGERQLEYLKRQGLQPHHRLLDIGCGPFRAGRHFIDYLDPGNYFAVDANHSLIQAGYDVELSDEQRDRLPTSNLRANDRFDVDFGVPFDFAIAQSVFTHVSLNHVRLCLYRLAPAMREGGEFYATVFVRPRSTPVDAIIPSKRGKPFLNEKNVFWHYSEDLRWASEVGPWRYTFVGDWGHPANQKMAKFVRVTPEPGTPQPVPTGKVAKSVYRGRRWMARHLDPTR